VLLLLLLLLPFSLRVSCAPPSPLPPASPAAPSHEPPWPNASVVVVGGQHTGRGDSEVVCVAVVVVVVVVVVVLCVGGGAFV